MGNCCRKKSARKSNESWAFSEKAVLGEPGENFVIFGQSRTGAPFMHQYRHYSRRLEPYRKQELPRFYNYSGVTMKDENTMIVCGGIQNNLEKISRDCFEFDLSSGVHRRIPDMINLRYTFPVVYFNDQIYALGGRVYGEDEESVLRDCEVYSFRTNRWTPIKPMKSKRCTGSAFIYNGQIWAIGGYSGNFVRSKHVECYDPRLDFWAELDFKLLQGFENGNIAANPYHPNELIIFGGKLNQGGSKHVWTYNFAQQTVINNRPLGCEAVLSKIHLGGPEKSKALIIAQGNISDQLSFINYDLEQMEMIAVETQNLRSLGSNLEKFKQYNYNCPNFVVSYDSSDIFVPKALGNHTLIFGTDVEPFQLEVCSRSGQVNVSPIPLALKLRKSQSCVRLPDGKVFFAGGTDSAHLKIYTRAVVYDPDTRLVDVLPHMSTCRFSAGSVFLDGEIFVVGGREYGQDFSAYLKYCEKFNLRTRTWSPLPVLNFSRSSPSCFVVNRRVFVAGGISSEPGTRDRALSSIEVLNPELGRWEVLGPTLLRELYGPVVIVRDSTVFFFGGIGQQELDEKFSIDFDDGDLAQTVEMTQSPLSRRAFLHKCIPVGGLIFLFGGTDFDHLECLDRNDFRTIKVNSYSNEPASSERSTLSTARFKETLVKAIDRVGADETFLLRPNSYVLPL